MKPTLDVNITFGKINISKTPYKAEIASDLRQSQIQLSKGELTVSSSSPEVRIDKKATYESLGNYGPVSFSQQRANEGIQASREATARIVAEGDELQQIEHEGNPLVEQISRRLQDEVEVGLSSIPEAPSVHVIGGEVMSEYHSGDVNVDLSEKMIKKAYMESGEVHTDVNPKPRIDIRIGE